jgi:hypothetical protein
MAPTHKKVNTPANAGVAPLRNIAVLESLLVRIIERPDHLPGIGIFSGPSGFGKSTAVAYVVSHRDAIYMEVRSTATKKSFLTALLNSMGHKPARTVAEMADQVAEDLLLSNRPLLLDEADNLVERNLIELVRDLYEQSKAPVILIGEERLPQKLTAWERFHGRVMDWQQALPADAKDVQTLARHYTPHLQMNHDLVDKLVREAHGSVRRIVTNLDRINAIALSEGWELVGLKEWGDRPLYTSNPPTPRKF